MVEVLGVDFRHGQAMTVKMFGKFEEGDIFFATAVENADGAGGIVRETDDFAAGTSQVTLKRLYAGGSRVKMPFEKPFKNVHGHGLPSIRSERWIRPGGLLG